MSVKTFNEWMIYQNFDGFKGKEKISCTLAIKPKAEARGRHDVLSHYFIQVITEEAHLYFDFFPRELNSNYVSEFFHINGMALNNSNN